MAETGLVRAQQSDISQIGTWARTAGGSGIDRARSQAIDKDQNIYVAGQFENSVTFKGGTTSITLNSKGGSDIFIAKYDKCGNLLWAKAIGDDGEDVAKSIVVDDLGSCYITGYFENIVDFNPGAGNNTLSSTLFTRDAFFGKYDKNGNYIWAKKIGGPDFDIGNVIRLDKTDGTGNIYVAGYFYGITNFNPSGSELLTAVGQADFFFAKYTLDGNFIWARSAGGDVIDVANDMQINNAGEVFLTGYYTALTDFNPAPTGVNNLISAGNEDIFLAKYNSSGNYVWARSMGGTTRTDQGLSIKLQSDGKILLAGQFGGTADFDPTTSTSTLTTSGLIEGFFSRYTATGALEFVKALGGGGDDVATSLTMDSTGRIYVGGYFSGSMDADPGSGVTTITGKGGRDLFIGKYSNLGELIWAKGTGGQTGNEVAQEISVDTLGNVYAAGTYANDVDFDPSDSTNNFIGSGADDAYVLKLDSNGLVSRVIFDINNNIQCFPDHEVILRNQSTAVNSNYVFTWDMGNGVTLTGNEIKYKYPVPGIYDIKLKVTDGATCNSQSIL
ncbi:MAG: PKD domain-containing protein, partial [Chitinophagia bacterium]